MRVSSANSSPTRTPWRAGSSVSSAKLGASGSPELPVLRRSSARTPRLELAHVERLDQVVVGARVEAVDAVLDRVARGEHQDRDAVARRAQPARDLEPVDVGQAHVEHHRVGRRGRDLGQRPRAVLRRDGVVAAQHERAAQRVAQGTVVVHDQNPHRRLILPGRAALFGDSYSVLTLLLHALEKL